MVPAETDLLCEFCGYTLKGLPEQSNCPECGHAIDASLRSQRRPPAWELARGFRAVGAFLTTTAAVILRPTEFFRTTTARGDLAAARRFGVIHWSIASVLLGITGSIHASLFQTTLLPIDRLVSGPLGIALVACVTCIALMFITWVANRLTAWEAAYRGLRLPFDVVRRSMYYHAAHYLPVALVALGTVSTYAFLFFGHRVDPFTLTPYLYVICGEVIVGAAYLFHTYWIGMRNMMYANR